MRTPRIPALLVAFGLVAAGTVAAALPSAAADPELPVTGQVHLGNASITQACDDTGHVTRTVLSVDYDGSRLGSSVGVAASLWAGQTVETPGPNIGVIQPGARGTLTRTVNWPANSGNWSTDAFDVDVHNGTATLHERVLEISAPHACAAGESSTTSQELTGPTATVTGPDCAGTVSIAVDNSASSTSWTPYVTVDGQPSAQPTVAAGAHSVVTVDLGNARGASVGVRFRTTRPDTGWRSEYTDGGTYGLSLPSAADCAATARGALAPVTPTRLVDTRRGVGTAKAPLAAGGRLTVQIGGRAGVPADAAAVVVDLTTVATRSGYLQAWTGVDGPSTGSVSNYVANRTTASTAIVPLDIHGRFAVRNAGSGPVQLLADVMGYVLGGPGAAADGGFVPQDAVRLFDSRTAGTRVPVAAGATVRVPVAGRQGIAATVGTLAARVTVTGTVRSGYLTAWTGSGIEPQTSTVDFGANDTVGTLTAVPVAGDGTVALTNHSAGTLHVLLDSEGWWRSGSGATGSLATLSPRRLVDTRVDGGALAAHASRTVDVTRPVGVADHLHGVAAALVVLTVTRPGAAGYLTVRLPADTGVPTTSDLDFAAGRTTSNAVLARVDDDGAIAVYNGSGAPADVIVDIVGYVSR